jgi:hypothetical protein
MQQRTVLATVQVGKHTLTVELVSTPEADQVVINWPGVATHVSAAKFPEVAATLTRLFSNASMTLARTKAGHKR